MQNFDMTVVSILCLCIFIVTFVCLYSRKKRVALEHKQREGLTSPGLGACFDSANILAAEGIIAVRKKGDFSGNDDENSAKSDESLVDDSIKYAQLLSDSPILAFHVMAKLDTTFSGYELLQVLLAAGLRFGSMNIFHYYRQLNTEHDILFSVSSATEPGVFDIQHMGGFSCVGLTLFMKRTGNQQEDKYRYDLMFQTASHLAGDLDAVLLDAKKNLLSPVPHSPVSHFPIDPIDTNDTTDIQPEFAL